MSASKYLRKEDNKVVEAKQITRIVGNEVHFNDGSINTYQDGRRDNLNHQLGYWQVASDEYSMFVSPQDFNQEYENYFAKDE